MTGASYDDIAERADFDAHMVWLRITKLIEEIDRIDPKWMIQ